MTDLREFMDLKFSMFAEKVSDLTNQVSALTQAVTKIAALEERQKTSDASVEKRLSKIEDQNESQEKRLNAMDVYIASKGVYFIVINLVLTALMTGTVGVMVKWYS